MKTEENYNITYGPEFLTTLKTALNDKGQTPYIITVTSGGVLQYMLMNTTAFKNPVTSKLIDTLLQYIHIDFDNLEGDGTTKKEIEKINDTLINLTNHPNWAIHY